MPVLSEDVLDVGGHFCWTHPLTVNGRWGSPTGTQVAQLRTSTSSLPLWVAQSSSSLAQGGGGHVTPEADSLASQSECATGRLLAPGPNQSPVCSVRVYRVENVLRYGMHFQNLNRLRETDNCFAAKGSRCSNSPCRQWPRTNEDLKNLLILRGLPNHGMVYLQCSVGKHLTNNSLGKLCSWCVAHPNLCGINIPTMILETACMGLPEPIIKCLGILQAGC